MIKLEANTDKEWALATMFEGMSDEELEVELDIVNEELLEAFSRFIDVAIDDNCDDYLDADLKAEMLDRCLGFLSYNGLDVYRPTIKDGKLMLFPYSV